MPVAEIISIGNELLQGRMDDTNATYVSRRLTELGINVKYRTTSGDEKEDITRALRDASERADIVISTGGLGPTVDDTTAEALADLLGVSLVRNKELEARVRKFYEMIGMPCRENALRQALVPEGAKLLMNPAGTAPCIIVRHGAADMAFFPGVPREMKAMLDAALDALLEGKIRGAAVSRTLRVFGVGESQLEHIIPREITTAANPSFSFLPVDFEIHLRLTARADTPEECAAILDSQCAELYKLAGEYIYGEGGDALETVAIKLLAEKGLTLACAESVTGGMVSSRLVGVAGASKVFKGGAVTYNDAAKADMLGVSSDSLEKYGAVSPEVAEEMAKGALEEFGADIGLSTTGNAGPDAQGKAPVGQVYVCVAFRDKNSAPVTAGRKMLRDRNSIRNVTSLFALDLLRRNV